MSLTNAQYASQFTTLLSAHLTLTGGSIFQTDLEALINSWLEGAITVAELARKLAETLGYWNQNQLEFKDWYTGTVTGGYNSNGTVSDGIAPHGGYYPLTNGVGSTAYFPSLAKLKADTLRGQDAAQDIHCWFQGLFSPNEVLGRYIHVGNDTSFDPALSKANSKVAATLAKTVTISKNGSAWGSVSWTAGQANGVITITGGSLVAGDILEFLAPASTDATLGDVTLHLAGVINYP